MSLSMPLLSHFHCTVREKMHKVRCNLFHLPNAIYKQNPNQHDGRSGKIYK
ncbi:Protein of unknown function [Pyronema omphalodes CBS 100304]|uniref:Uncharacterized protein n=1 Tax=Pyronema omphalodes (strain CBS 100304) TaxID=1076935 RepID=U4LQ36_PYROM|nr:Protein of unknown function [Pyronema omphalodes CBS 100304]